MAVYIEVEGQNLGVRLQGERPEKCEEYEGRCAGVSGRPRMIFRENILKKQVYGSVFENHNVIWIDV